MSNETMDKKDMESGLGQGTPQLAPSSGMNTGSVAILAVTGIIACCCIAMVAELGSLVSSASLSSKPANIYVNPGGSSSSGSSTSMAMDEFNPGDNGVEFFDGLPEEGTFSAFGIGENICAGKKPDLPDTDCIIDAMTNVGPQAGANVTKGYKGAMEVDYVPVTTPYWMNGMCPVNVHWHIGAEHLSVGEFDENGKGPVDPTAGLDGEHRIGFQCHHYDESDPKFVVDYEWKHCKNMMVGQTYEVHWPHSAAGACGTPNQYQTPFYDGVFCIDGILTETEKQIGVQSQVFTIVNDEAYFWPDLMRGMIVDGEKGQDIAKYTGSTTGSSRNNEICSQYSPITWQVDRKCHMISASSFDKMCADMKMQRDDMSGDLYPHGSRPLVDSALVANNQHNRKIRA